MHTAVSLSDRKRTARRAGSSFEWERREDEHELVHPVGSQTSQVKILEDKNPVPHEQFLMYGVVQLRIRIRVNLDTARVGPDQARFPLGDPPSDRHSNAG